MAHWYLLIDPGIATVRSAGWRSVIGPGPSTPLDVSSLNLPSRCFSATLAGTVRSDHFLTRDEAHDSLPKKCLGVRPDQVCGSLECLPGITSLRPDQICGGDRRRAVLGHHTVDEDLSSGGDTVPNEVGCVAQHPVCQADVRHLP